MTIQKLRKDLIEKRKGAMGTPPHQKFWCVGKFNSARENFEKKEKKVKADLEKAGRIWKELGERFKWWQILP